MKMIDRLTALHYIVNLTSVGVSIIWTVTTDRLLYVTKYYWEIVTTDRVPKVIFKQAIPIQSIWTNKKKNRYVWF